MRNKGRRLDAGQGLPDIDIEIGEGLSRPRRLDPGLVLNRALEVVVGEGQHAAVGVMDQDDLAGAEQSLADRQRADLVLGYDPAGITDDVRLALVQPEQTVDVEPGVHARNHRELLGRRQRQRPVETLGIALVVGQQVVGHGHPGSVSLAGGSVGRPAARQAR